MVATSAKAKSGVGPETRAVGTKVTQREVREIHGLIEAGVYISISDFVREAIRDKLRAIKVVKVRDRAYDEAKQEVLGYYRAYKEAYPHEVAEDLELDYDLVWQITEELKAEKRLEVVE
jgi:Arc/MetJ-type ribon-helix-helix transcriptional regulator